MNELIGTSLVESELKDCENCGMEKSSTDDNGCCKEEYKQLKVDLNEGIEDFALQMMQTLGTSLPPFAFEIPSFLQLSNSATEFPLVNSPPENISAPVYLRNCTFRI